MGYATISDLVARNPLRSFTASSRPSLDEAVTFLEDAAVELDALLHGAGYQLPVPVTATVALRLLRTANAVGAWASVEEASPVSQDADRARKEWARLQAQLNPGSRGVTLELPGVPRQAGETRPRGGVITAGASPTSRQFSLDPDAW